MRYKLILFLFFLPILIFGQQKPISNLDLSVSHNVGDCFGAINIATNASAYMELFGNKGEFDDFKNGEQHLEGKETNSLWFRSKSSVSGYLSMAVSGADFPLNYVAFRLDKNDNCESIHSGNLAPIQKGSFKEKNTLMFMLDSLRMKPNQEVIFCINSRWSTKSDFVLISSFTDEITDRDFETMRKIHDFRDLGTEEPFKIKIRDASTYLPVVSNVIIYGARKNNALYHVSDFIFPYSNNLKVNLKIDAEGYFHNDQEVYLRQWFLKEYVIFLTAIDNNKSIELVGLGFYSQTDDLIPESFPKLLRLRDFMVTNPKIEIVIQGHVHGLGGSLIGARRLSRKRAKKVRQYLVESGIEKSRMSVLGFGSSKMKYPEAKTEAEIQANRRVEVRIR